MKKPTWRSKDGAIRLYKADCRDVLPLAKPVETCITDPPHDLTANKKGGSGPASVNLNSPQGRARITAGFMEKSWDGTGVAFDPATWAKVLDSLLPGAMLLAFGGTRTYHRQTCAIEDAGFEIRDCLCWLYGQGFPKSLDISKAIDDAAGAEREVVGYDASRARPNRLYEGGAIGNIGGSGVTSDRTDNGATKTAPATDSAKQWDGWGTALKPALEPIVLAMRPLDGTFAANAQQHGVAGLNIESTRIATTSPRPLRDGRVANPSAGVYGDGLNGSKAIGETTLGRWPANVVMDQEAGAILDSEVGTLISGKPAGTKAGNNNNVYGQYAGGIPVTGFGDMGGPHGSFIVPRPTPPTAATPSTPP